MATISDSPARLLDDRSQDDVPTKSNSKDVRIVRPNRAISREKRALPRRYSLAMTLGGLSLGYIVGMAESPTIQPVVAGMLTLVVGTVSLMVGIRLPSLASRTGNKTHAKAAPRRWQGNPWPVALLIFGVAVGSTFGFIIRVNHLLIWRAESVAAAPADSQQAHAKDGSVPQSMPPAPGLKADSQDGENAH